MDPKQLLWPVLAQVGLTMLVYLRLLMVKGKAKRSGEADYARTPLHLDAWPDSVIQVSNNLSNQYESPVLFYALIFVVTASGAASTLSVALAWAFVATRVAHATIHMGSNQVKYRLPMFSLGIAALVGLFAVAVHAMV